MTHTSIIRLCRAALVLAVLSAAGLVVKGVAFAQPAAQAPEISLLVQTFFGVETMDDCKSRVVAGFRKAGYTNIVQEPDGFKGQMLTGDNRGISSVVACSTSGSALVLSIASAGGTSGAPDSQSSRLFAAIKNQ